MRAEREERSEMGPGKPYSKRPEGFTGADGLETGRAGVETGRGTGGETAEGLGTV